MLAIPRVTQHSNAPPRASNPWSLTVGGTNQPEKGSKAFEGDALKGLGVDVGDHGRGIAVADGDVLLGDLLSHKEMSSCHMLCAFAETVVLDEEHGCLVVLKDVNWFSTGGKLEFCRKTLQPDGFACTLGQGNKFCLAGHGEGDTGLQL